MEKKRKFFFIGTGVIKNIDLFTKYRELLKNKIFFSIKKNINCISAKDVGEYGMKNIKKKRNCYKKIVPLY